jgi:hypothetical protein
MLGTQRKSRPKAALDGTGAVNADPESGSNRKSPTKKDHMRNALHTIEQAKAQARVFGDALIDAEGDEVVSSKVRDGCANDYRDACALVVKIELAQFRAERPPQDFTDTALLDALSDEHDLDEKHYKKLKNAGPSLCTTREEIDAEFAVVLAQGKWSIVFRRKDRRPDRPQFTTLRGERIPIVRTPPTTKRKKS